MPADEMNHVFEAERNGEAVLIPFLKQRFGRGNGAFRSEPRQDIESLLKWIVKKP